MKKILFAGLLFFNIAAFAQQDTSGYVYSLQKFQEKYVATHNVVKGEDTAYLKFFPIDSNYRVTATFEKIKDDTGFIMQLSENKTAKYFKYGKVTFILQNKPVTLFLYQSKRLMKTAQYKNYLFIPFIDLSNGATSYGGGRYLDIDIKDIKGNKLTIDFNKAYNPSCSYTTGYNCPIPPGENTILLSVNAGEKTYAKPMH
jgi:uncharacterized protein (DUF1684 family)